MTKTITRNCNICSTRITGNEATYIKHGNDKHPNHYLQGWSNTPSSPKYAEKNYWCPLDNTWYQSRKYLARTIKAQGWTNGQYYETYGKEFMPVEWLENETHKTVGNAHNTKTCLQCNGDTPHQEGKWTYPAFCGYACSTKWYAVNSTRIDTAMATLRARKAIDPNHHLRPNQKQYWLNKGLTEDAAILKVKERNAVNSLSRYIERANGNVVEGTEKWKDRQTRWQATLNAKPEEERERIRLLKITSYKSESYSTVSFKMFEKVQHTISDIVFGPYEKTIRLSFGFVKPDCIRDNKVIEFFGDYWHGNPIKYKSDDVVARGSFASSLWQKDKLRVEGYNEKGYEVLIVWESEYKDNPDETVLRCIEFLNSK